MTTPPRTTAPAPRLPWPATALPDAIRYVLLGAAGLITDDGDTGTPGLLQAGAECACGLHGLPASLAPVIYRRAALCLARASGYQPPAPPTRSSTAPSTSCPATRPSARPGS
jgi:hypothetical protein